MRLADESEMEIGWIRIRTFLNRKGKTVPFWEKNGNGTGSEIGLGSSCKTKTRRHVRREE